MRDSKNSKGSQKVVDFNLDEQPRSGAPETAKEEGKEEVAVQVKKPLDPERAKKDLLEAHGK